MVRFWVRTAALTYICTQDAQHRLSASTTVATVARAKSVKVA